MQDTIIGKGPFSLEEARRHAADILKRNQPQVDEILKKFPPPAGKDNAVVPPEASNTAVGTLAALIILLDADARCGQTPCPA